MDVHSVFLEIHLDGFNYSVMLKSSLLLMG